MSFFDSLKKAADNVVKAVGNETKEFVFDSIPTNLAELKARPEANLSDPFGVVALYIVSLCIYPANSDASFEMVDFLKGPSPLSPMEKSFIKDRFSDKDYVPRSYFKGATPDNNYTPAEPVTIAVSELAHSHDVGENRVTLYITSGGADSPRGITLRKKPSTGEWFIENDPGSLAGIRVPKAADPWA